MTDDELDQAVADAQGNLSQAEIEIQDGRWSEAADELNLAKLEIDRLLGHVQAQAAEEA